MAYENKAVGLHAIIDVRHQGKWQKKTTVGRAIFNSIMPEELEYFDELISKKTLSKVVNQSYLIAGNYKTVEFLDKLKDLGFSIATSSGSSISINDILIPSDKDVIIDKAEKEVEGVQQNFVNHILTDGERYNKIIDIWTHATNHVANSMMKALKEDRQGFNPVFMMADSGARGSQDQIKQLAGMRGLMAKPKKSMTGGKGEIIESPIISNFKEGLSVMEYFISTHGARKGLADTALKTADAGYLTRRLVDVAQDVVISEDDCGTINGIVTSDLKEGEEIIEQLSDRVLGRTVLDDLIIDGKVVIKAGTIITEQEADIIARGEIQNIRIRSVLTCESKRGVCGKCYGWDLARHRVANMGSAVGIIAAQSIGEPGTQLTLRTFHIGGTATRIIEKSDMKSRYGGVIKFSDNYDFAKTINEAGNEIIRCMVRHSKMFSADEQNPTNIKAEFNIPYGSNILVSEGDVVKAGTILVQWDPYTDIILARHDGFVNLKDFIEGDTYQIEAVEGGKKQMVVVESKDRQLSPQVEIQDKDGNVMAGGVILPVNASLNVIDKQEVKHGQTLVKIQRDIGKTRDITGGLPRVAELFEARMPSNPAVVTEINGTVKFGETKRGIRKILIEARDGESRGYKIPYGKHVVVHEGDFITAGTPLCEGAISPVDILSILGPGAVREYLVNEIQEVYRLQGVGINDKHIEVIVRQMMKKIRVTDPGDSRFLESQRVDRVDFTIENERLATMAVVADAGDSDWEKEALISKSELREINKELKDNGGATIKTHKTQPATYDPLLMGITQASLNTESYLSAASFQETTRVLTDAATAGKTDHLRGLKENVVIGRLIPAGTGYPALRDVLLDSEEEKKNEVPIEIPIDEIV